MLLPFGTLAPGLLLPLLAFAYMLFFGSYALHKSAGEEMAADPEVRPFIETEVSLPVAAAPFIFLTQDDGTGPDTDVPGCLTNAGLPLFTVIKIPPEDIITDTNLRSCFARPPPAVSIA